jgi:hypothetical protein
MGWCLSRQKPGNPGRAGGWLDIAKQCGIRVSYGCERDGGGRELPINIPSVADMNNIYRLIGIIYIVNHPIISDPDSPSIPAG